MPGHWISNKVILAVVILEGILMALGIILTIKGYFLGVILGIIAVTMFVKGLKEHSSNPLTFGLITIWNKPSELCGVVSGIVPLLNFFPFWVNTIDIDMTLKDRDIPVEDVLSSDDVPMGGKVSITLRPDKDDLIDYIGAGQMKGVFDIADDLIIIDVEKFCKKQAWRDIQQKSPNFEKELKEMIETHPFGVKVRKIQVRLYAPKDLLTDVMQQQKEIAQRRGELAEFATTLEAATLRLDAIRATAQPGQEIPTLESQIGEINRERLIRNDKTLRIEGNAQSVIISDASINFGGKTK